MASLDEILLAREARAARQAALTAQFRVPLVSATMNICGPCKSTPLSSYAFSRALRSLRAQLPSPVAQETGENAAGSYAFVAFDIPAQKLKEVCAALEESEIGRLYDLDVLTADGKKLSRAQPRRCLLCSAPAFDCARSRNHGLDALQRETQRRLREFAAQELAEAAYAALCAEAHFTPKPGLVDKNNRGAHRDMDVPLLCRSAAALRPYFAEFVRMGLRAAPADALQVLGRDAEEAMLRATSGVNTHKGALYSLALLLSACGRILSGAQGEIWTLAAQIAAQLPEARATHGALVRKLYGASGVRDEAVGGFSTLRQLLVQEDARTALLCAMAQLEDSCLLYRSGRGGLEFVQNFARKILSLPEAQREAALLRMDEALTQQNLSPGGSADLLALWYFAKSQPEFF